MKKLEKEKVSKATPNQSEETQPIAEESKVRRVLNIVVNTILVIAIILAAICTYVSYVNTSGNGVPSIFGIRMFSIKTNSMYPILNPGDLIFDTAVDDPSTLRPGDIITYWTVIEGERKLNTHAIYEVYDGDGFLFFKTKGEKNSAVDPISVHESEIVGKYSGTRIPGLGQVFEYLQSPNGFLVVIVIPVFLFFLFHLVQFFRVLFEYQNVKNRIKFEQERGRAEDLIAEQKRQQEAAQAEARAKMEEELRAKLREEILASMAAQKQAEEAPAQEEVPQEAAQESVPNGEVAAEEQTENEEQL